MYELLLIFLVIPAIGWLLGVIAFFRTNGKSQKINQLNYRIEKLENQLKNFTGDTTSSTTLINNYSKPIIEEAVKPVNSIIHPSYSQNTNITPNKPQTLNSLVNNTLHKEVNTPKPEVLEPHTPNLFESFLAWLAKDWLMKLGALMVFLAVLWFFSLAFNNFSNEFKLLTVLIGSVGTFLFGLYSYAKNKDVGQVLIALGSIVTVLTFSYGYNEFRIIPSLLVSVASIFVIGITYYIANIKKSLPLAVLSTIGFYLVPFLAVSQEPNLVSLGLYILFTNLFILGTTIINKWEILITIATLFTGFFMTSMTLSSLDITKTLISPQFLVVIANIAVLYLFNIFYSNRKVNFGPLTILNSIICTLYTAIVIPAFFYDDVANLSLIITAFVLFAAAALLYISNINKSFLYIQISGSIGMIILATINIFHSNPYMPVIVALELMVAMFGLYNIYKDKAVLKVFNVFQIILAFYMMFAINFMSLIWVYAYLLVLVGHLIINIYYDDSEENFGFITAFGAIIGVLFSRLIWLTFGSIFGENETTTALFSMITFTILGVVLAYLLKLEKKFEGLKYYGYALLAFVIGKLFLVDFWSMPIEARIIVFVLVGILFISTPFLRKQNKK